jgi:hypothetical protein
MLSGGDGTNHAVIRVLLADMPTLLAEIIAAAISKCSNIQIVAGFTSDDESLEVAIHDVDVLLVSHALVDSLPERYRRLLMAKPALRILNITTTSDMGVVFWLGVCQRQQPITTIADLGKAIVQARTTDSLSDRN